MKVVFFSNFINHHQIPFCLAMDQLTNHEFVFVATTPIDKERLSMGFEDGNNKYSFVLNTYDSKSNLKTAKELAIDADIAIMGANSAPFLRIRNTKKNKLTFMFYERALKEGNKWYKYLERYIRWHIRYPMKNPIYMLSASAYTTNDFYRFSLFKDRCYKWGYFPEVIRYENIDALIQNKKANTILWVARMIDWKHPEVPIKLAKMLLSEGYDFDINMIGNGVLESKIEKMVIENDLVNHVHLLGTMSPNEVRTYMEESSIFIFTSDKNEGWGAVLNEAMNSGCAVIANNEIGSVPFLISDNINGLIYHHGDIDELYRQVVFLLKNKAERHLFGKNAYETMQLWDAQVAAERLLMLADCLKNKQNTPYDYGPCSIAGLVEE